MLSAACLPVLVMDDRGRIVLLNKACESLIGYAADQARGRSFADLVLSPPDAAAWTAYVNPLRPERFPARTEVAWKTRSGEFRYVASWNSLISFESERPSHVISIGQDVTENRRLELALLRTSEHERRRLGEDLHDGLGQDLTAIGLSAEILRVQLSAEGHAGAGIAERIQALASNAIASTRALARDRLLPLEREDLRSRIDWLARRVQETFNVKCQASLEDGIDLPDKDTATQLYWIVQEAVTNAVRHAQARSIRIHGQRDERRLRVTVRDDGRGLKPQTEASGLGLAIMRSRARGIGAELQIMNAPEGGVLVECVLAVKEP